MYNNKLECQLRRKNKNKNINIDRKGKIHGRKKRLCLVTQPSPEAVYEAGVKVSAAYPGTPSTEISENMVQYKGDIYSEWSPNEKVATEVAIGGIICGSEINSVDEACRCERGIRSASSPQHTQV